MTDTKIKPLALHFETSPCGRCCGTGYFGPKSVKGGVCFQCGGGKNLLTRRARTARDRFDSLLVERLGRPSTELKAGDVVFSHYTTIVDGWKPVDSPKRWRRIKSVEITDHGPTTFKIGDEERTENRTSVHIEFVSARGEKTIGLTATREYLDGWLFPVYDDAVVEEIMRTVAAKYTGAWLDGEEPPARPVRKPRKPKAEEEKKTVAKPEPKPLAANLYPGDCRKCGGHVEAKAGERERVDGRWEVQHKDGECPAPAPAEEPQQAPQEPAEDDGATRVVLTRSQLYPEVARPGPAWVWTYDYAVNGAPAIGYGPGLASLRDMLRHKFGRDVIIVESWKAQQAAPADRAQEAPQREERPARPAMPNKFPGKCHHCGVRVPEGAGERVNEGGQWITRHKDGECIADTTVKVTEEGLYRIPGGATPHADVFRVRLSERSGRLYAERFVPHTEEGGGARFVYDPAAVYRLEPVHRMTAEEAAEIGRKLHTCMQCGEHLTDPKSVARGIGPVCRKKV